MDSFLLKTQNVVGVTEKRVLLYSIWKNLHGLCISFMMELSRLNLNAFIETSISLRFFKL